MKIAIVLAVVILVITIVVLYYLYTQPEPQQSSYSAPNTPDASDSLEDVNLPNTTAQQAESEAINKQSELPDEPLSEADKKLLEYALHGNYEALKAGFVPDKHLSLADEQGYTLFMLGVDGGNQDILAYLMEAGANVNDRLDNGISVLHMAVSAEYEESVAALIENGANVNAKADRDQRTPLMWAASSGNTNVVKMLLKAGADITIKDAHGYTAEDHAESSELKKLIRGN